MTEILYKDEVFHIMGAAMEVHDTLGPGFLEPVYQEAFEMELVERGIPFEAQKTLPISYKNRILKKEYIADLVGYNAIIIEIKAIAQITAREEAQLLNYLKATGLRLGLLINFNSHMHLEWKRMVK